MDFLQQIDTAYLTMGLLAIFLIGHFIVQRKNNLKLTLQFRLIFYAIVMIVLWISLPSTPSLSSFGYPGSISDVEDKEKLLKYLQDYNQAIVKTTEVVYWMIFITTFWLLSIMSSVIKHFKLEKSAE